MSYPTEPKAWGIYAQSLEGRRMGHPPTKFQIEEATMRKDMTRGAGGPRASIAALVLLLGTALPTAFSQPQQKGQGAEPELKETSLGLTAQGILYFSVSDEGEHWLYGSGGHVFTLNGLLPELTCIVTSQKGPSIPINECAGIRVSGNSQPTLSPDGQHFAYVENDGRRVAVELDGIAIGETPPRGCESCEASRIEGLRFSGDGSSLIYVAGDSTHSANWIVVHPINTKHPVYAGRSARTTDNLSGIEETYAYLDPDFVTASYDGKHLAYVVQRTENSGLQVVVNQVRSTSYYNVSLIAMSTNGDHFAYAARDDASSGYYVVRDGRVVRDGEDGQSFASITGVTLSSDGSRLSYFVKSANRWSVIIDGVKGKSFNDVSRGEFSPDGSRFDFPAKSGSKWYLVSEGGEVGSGHDEVQHVVFSRDSHRLAYVVQDGKMQAVVLDGEVGQSYERIDVGSLVFSRDSKDFAYAANRGSTAVEVFDGREISGYDEILPKTTRFNKSGNLLFYALKGGMIYKIKYYLHPEPSVTDVPRKPLPKAPKAPIRKNAH